MKIMKAFIGFLIIILFTLFATSNIEEVHVNLFNKDQSILGYNDQGMPSTAPLFLVIYAGFGLGFVVAWLLSSTQSLKYKRNLRSLQKQYKALMTETEKLRNLPVRDTEEDSSGKAHDAGRETDDIDLEEGKV
ncbi:MAG: LapA family protein [bacterium]